MPLPKPQKKESKDDFISRCMGDSLMNVEYPDRSQRYAICLNQWENKNKGENNERRQNETA